MSKVAAGTQSTLPGYTNYTTEQLAALEPMKDRAYALGIARAEFVNHVLCPDGAELEDAAVVATAVSDRLTEILTRDIRDPAVLDAAKRAAEAVQEVTEHIAQGRFLFIVDADLCPVIYFQCAVDHNPDLPALAEADADAPTPEG